MRERERERERDRKKERERERMCDREHERTIMSERTNGIPELGEWIGRIEGKRTSLK